MNTKTPLAEMLRLWRAANGFSVRSAAERIGIPYQTYGRIEMDQGKIDSGTVFRLIGFLFNDHISFRRGRQ